MGKAAEGEKRTVEKLYTSTLLLERRRETALNHILDRHGTVRIAPASGAIGVVLTQATSVGGGAGVGVVCCREAREGQEGVVERRMSKVQDGGKARFRVKRREYDVEGKGGTIEGTASNRQG